MNFKTQLKNLLMKTKMYFSGNSFQLFILIGLGVFLLSVANSFAQKADFSGTWTLNDSKSDLGDSQFRGAFKIAATQEANSLDLVRLSKGRNDEDRTSVEKYALDGFESQNTGFMNSVKKSKASWSADGKVLTINSVMTFERDGEKREFASSEVWSLSPNGKNLTIMSSFNTQNGEFKQIRVYDKM